MWLADRIRPMRCSIFSCTSRGIVKHAGALRCGLRDEEGQATVEAALLLPAMMVCMALLIQPACMLYTRAVMESAAAEACRLVATTPSTTAVSNQAYEAYVVRRLAGVPDLDVFHCGGREGWHITMKGATASHSASVTIETTVRPLPLLGVIPALLGRTDGAGNVVMRVEVTTTTRPGWLEGDYDGWASLWS